MISLCRSFSSRCIISLRARSPSSSSPSSSDNSSTTCFKSSSSNLSASSSSFSFSFFLLPNEKPKSSNPAVISSSSSSASPSTRLLPFLLFNFFNLSASFSSIFFQPKFFGLLPFSSASCWSTTVLLPVPTFRSPSPFLLAREIFEFSLCILEFSSSDGFVGISKTGGISFVSSSLTFFVEFLATISFSSFKQASTVASSSIAMPLSEKTTVSSSSELLLSSGVDKSFFSSCV
mmetsp:Transcript_1902/g.2311  ORF Transcript_1902/g.2311 Transcript_1902/m.2311 type:complete len:233 (+) Transcript_1902:1043-1741(+)